MPLTNKSTIADNIRKYRNKIGVSQDRLSKLAKPSNKNWEGSTKYYYFSISKQEDMSYALDLIKQSYKSTL